AFGSMTQGSKPLIFVSKRLTDRSPRILLQRNALMNINGSFWPIAAIYCGSFGWHSFLKPS
ncbi:hypothetical protein, partial [Pseudomonas glycinae]|uniref:hypothetical protein n=1 Tax=Pseudomonas glycinae TaxID=1785145 RepID=UPI001F252C4A